MNLSTILACFSAHAPIQVSAVHLYLNIGAWKLTNIYYTGNIGAPAFSIIFQNVVFDYRRMCQKVRLYGIYLFIPAFDTGSSLFRTVYHFV